MSIPKQRIKKLEEVMRAKQAKKPIPILSFLRGHTKEDLDQYETFGYAPLECYVHPHNENDL